MNKIKNWNLSVSPFTQILNMKNMKNPPKPSPSLPLKHHRIQKKKKTPQHRPPPSNHNHPQITCHHHYSINTSQTQKIPTKFPTHRTTNNHQDPHPLPLPNPPLNHQPPLPIKHHDPRPIFKAQKHRSNPRPTTYMIKPSIKPRNHGNIDLNPRPTRYKPRNDRSSSHRR